MPPELATAIVGAIISAVVAMGATAALLPRFMDSRMEIYKKAQEAKIATAKQISDNAIDQARQEREAAEEQRKQFGRLIDSLINERSANTEQQQVMVKALTGSVNILDGMAKELRANTSVSTEGVKEIGELTDRFDELLDTGSKPLQALGKRVDELATGVSAIITNQRDTTEKVNYIHEKIAEIVSLKSTLDIMLKVAEAKLEDVRKATGDNPSVSLVITPSA